MRGAKIFEQKLAGTDLPSAPVEVIVSPSNGGLAAAWRRLGYQAIIHAVGPRVVEGDAAKRLTETVLNCVRTAEFLGGRALGDSKRQSRSAMPVGSSRSR